MPTGQARYFASSLTEKLPWSLCSKCTLNLLRQITGMISLAVEKKAVKESIDQLFPSPLVQLRTLHYRQDSGARSRSLLFFHSFNQRPRGTFYF